MKCPILWEDDGTFIRLDMVTDCEWAHYDSDEFDTEDFPDDDKPYRHMSGCGGEEQRHLFVYLRLDGNHEFCEQKGKRFLSAWKEYLKDLSLEKSTPYR